MFRMIVDMVIARGRDGVVIACGEIVSGRVERHDTVSVKRGNKEAMARVKQIDDLGKLDLDYADTNLSRVALVLDGVTPQDVQEGAIIDGVG